MLYQIFRVETKSIINCSSHHKLVGRLNSTVWAVWWREDWADGHHVGPVKPGFRKPVLMWASNKEPFRSHLSPVLGNLRIYLEEPGLCLLWSWLGLRVPVLLESSIIRGLNHLPFGLTAGILDKHQSYWWIWTSLWFVAPCRDGQNFRKTEQENKLQKPFAFSSPPAQTLFPFWIFHAPEKHGLPSFLCHSMTGGSTTPRDTVTHTVRVAWHG